MSSTPRPHGRVQHAADQVNELIRRLMNEPPSPRRAAKYERLLWRWADATDTDVTEAA